MQNAYLKKKNRLESAPQSASKEAKNETPALPNSLLLAMHGGNSENEGNPELENIMKSRLAAFHRQIPAAENEADKLSFGITSGTPEQVKQSMGERLGTDFSSVQFHTGESVSQRADNMGARAWTQGNDVYFGEGGFHPAVAAHELVHTVQQGAVDSSAVNVSAPMGGVQMWNPLRWMAKRWRLNRQRRERAQERQQKAQEENQWKLHAIRHNLMPARDGQASVIGGSLSQAIINNYHPNPLTELRRRRQRQQEIQRLRQILTPQQKIEILSEMETQNKFNLVVGQALHRNPGIFQVTQPPRNEREREYQCNLLYSAIRTLNILGNLEQHQIKDRVELRQIINQPGELRQLKFMPLLTELYTFLPALRQQQQRKERIRQIQQQQWQQQQRQRQQRRQQQQQLLQQPDGPPES